MPVWYTWRMSQLLARIMLALLMLPLGAMLYLIVVVTLLRLLGYRHEDWAFWIANAATAVFVGAYWVALWRRAVTWTPPRVVKTLIAAGLCAFAGVVLGFALAEPVADSFGIFAGGALSILLWLVVTVFLWKDTPEERAARASGVTARAITCLTCGYNMTGLHEPTCPECGARYTLDELYASQADREQEQLEDSAAK